MFMYNDVSDGLQDCQKKNCTDGVRVQDTPRVTEHQRCGALGYMGNGAGNTVGYRTRYQVRKGAGYTEGDGTGDSKGESIGDAGTLRPGPLVVGRGYAVNSLNRWIRFPW